MSVREKVRTAINGALRPLGVEMRAVAVGSDRLAWQLNPEFKAIAGKVAGRTLLSPHRLFALWQWANYARSLGGDVAEMGVYKGGGSYVLASVCQAKRIYLFDTFTGLPEADENRLAKGAFGSVSIEDVQAFVSRVGDVVMRPGFFPQTASAIPDHSEFCLVHLDGDLYQSTRDGLEFFYPRMVQGGVLVVDDYLSQHEGVTRAVDEFVMGRPEQAIVSAAGQCVIIKIGAR